MDQVTLSLEVASQRECRASTLDLEQLRRPLLLEAPRQLVRPRVQAERLGNRFLVGTVADVAQLVLCLRGIAAAAAATAILSQHVARAKARAAAREDVALEADLIV